MLWFLLGAGLGVAMGWNLFHSYRWLWRHEDLALGTKLFIVFFDTVLIGLLVTMLTFLFQE